MGSSQDKKSDSYLSGQLLIAMPTMRDPRFARTVIYMCAHTAEGAMGIVVNRLVGSLSFNDLLKQLALDGTGSQDARKVHFGGPVETSRGFVLHSSDKLEEGSLLVDDRIALTSTTDILRSIAAGDGPTRSLLALGYAGWGPASSMPSCRPIPGSTPRPTRTCCSTRIWRANGPGRWPRSASPSACSRARPGTRSQTAGLRSSRYTRVAV